LRGAASAADAAITAIAAANAMAPVHERMMILVSIEQLAQAYSPLLQCTTRERGGG
jgi:putative SOS response-associated peptidase YedK